MKKYLLLILIFCPLLFASTSISEANQDLIQNILLYGRGATAHVGSIFVQFQTTFFKYAYFVVVLLIPFVFFVHYVIIGPKRFSHDGNKIYLFTLFNRIVHAIAALSFIILIPTGLIMIFGSFFEGGVFVRTCKELHAISTLLFVISIVPMFLMWVKNMFFNRDDIKWMMILGGYLSKVKKPVPAGKFNAGQKMWFWVCTVGGLLMIITGALLYVQDLNGPLLSFLGMTQIKLLRVSIIVHNIIGIAVTALFFTHMYMSMFAIKGAIHSIINGYKEEEEVQILHSSFYKELKSK